VGSRLGYVILQQDQERGDKLRALPGVFADQSGAESLAQTFAEDAVEKGLSLAYSVAVVVELDGDT